MGKGSITITIDETEANVRMMLDEKGRPYALVRIEGLTARHYPKKHGVPDGAGDPPMGSDACIFLEGEPCWIV